jgi:hypothetical protein
MMKKLLATLSVVLVAGFAAIAQNNENPNAAEITFEKEVHDYGTIDKGGDGTYEFVFTNTGKEPLIIKSCKGSCGCTVPKWPNEPIAPGATGVIKVKYDTNRMGQFNKSVTVNSNAKTPVKVIKIKGNVVTPQGANLEKSTSGAPVANP